MKLTFVDLFAGVGMARMGMEQAGFECVYTCEFDKHKRKEYEIIHGNEPEGCDIRDVRAADIPRADVWFFGAPCQDFSIAGLRKGLDGDRSSLIGEVFRLIEEKAEDKPTWLVYENVKGMLSSNYGYDFLSILLAMDGLGYDVEWQTLNSKDFGVPQNRERVYTIGHLRAKGSKQILPITSADGKDSNTKINVVGSTNPGRKIQQRKYIYGDEGLIGCLIATDYKEPKIVQIGRMKSNRENPNQQGVIVKACITPDRIEKRQNGKRFKEDGEPMFTLTKQDIHGVFIQNGEEYVIRKLTPKECMRLQGVPDEYTDKLIQAGISDSQIYKAAGDGLSVPIAKEIGERIRKTYE
jgi:DNA (cytosine-5)-methyltransferase 1